MATSRSTTTCPDKLREASTEIDAIIKQIMENDTSYEAKNIIVNSLQQTQQMLDDLIPRLERYRSQTRVRPR